MKSTLKKALSLMLAVLTLVCVMPMRNDVVEAASVVVNDGGSGLGYPAFSNTKFCEFIAEKDIAVFKNTKLSTSMGTIKKGAAGEITAFSTNYLTVKYNNTTGYVHRSDVLQKNPIDKMTAESKTTAIYKKIGNSFELYGNNSYIDANDTVYTVQVEGDYVQVIYPAGSHWKLAWTTLDGYTVIKGIPFVDVAQSKSYYNAVAWAYKSGVTSGKTKTTFAPNDSATRAEFVTFLWAYAGRPEPETTNNPFTDVKKKNWFYKAVLWAVEKKITSGTSETEFSPDVNCMHCDAVTFIWALAGKPEPKSTNNPFTDVKKKDWYYKAVIWAVENKIVDATGKTEFKPKAECTRAEFVTFLYNYNKSIAIKPNIDYEVSSYYKNSQYYTNLLNVNLTGNQRTDIVAIARSQVGYHEGNSDADLGGNSNGNNNYTEYNYWYYDGNHNGGEYYPWCAVFVTWCARRAGVSKSTIQGSAIACPDDDCFKVKYIPKEDDIPQVGDLIFFKNSEYTWAHVGIVSSVNASNGKLNSLTLIEGNTNNNGSSEGVVVRESTIKVTDSRYSKVNGYGRPEYKG